MAYREEAHLDQITQKLNNIKRLAGKILNHILLHFEKKIFDVNRISTIHFSDSELKL